MSTEAARASSGATASTADPAAVDAAAPATTVKPYVPPPSPTLSAIPGVGKRCRSVDEFERLNRIDEGTYGVVYRARDTKSGEVVALKRIKMEKEREGFPLTSVREFGILLACKHPCIMDVREVVVGAAPRDRPSADAPIFMVMEYVDHDLRDMMDAMTKPFTTAEIKCMLRQLIDGVNHLHEDMWCVHRDIKTSNILYSNRGEVKLCDFGLARHYGAPIRPYTPVVVTLWYRAPELLLGVDKYSTPIDNWSLGCVMAELLLGKPLFAGKAELEQLHQIFSLLGTPTEAGWPAQGTKGEADYVPGYLDMPGVQNGVRFREQPHNSLRAKFPKHSPYGMSLSDAGFDLLSRFLAFDPSQRITAKEALSHPWFSESPLPKDQSLMPTFPTKHERAAM